MCRVLIKKTRLQCIRRFSIALYRCIDICEIKCYIMPRQAMRGEGYRVFTVQKKKKHPSAFFALHDTYWTDVDDVWWRNHYRQRINWLHFGRNCKRDKKAGYNRKFVSTSNRYCHVTNDFTHFRVSTYVTLRPQGWRVHYTHAAGGIIWPCAIFSFSVSFYLDVIILDHYK